MENIQQRLKTLQQELQTGLVGRSQSVKIALLALLAEENVLLVGPPGTAKSLLARKIAQSIQSSEEKGTVPYFEYLLTKFSTPEEIFGPLSISELKKDCFKRNTLGYLPSAQVGFLDEIFKASSSILNSLLTIMNEKLYHNGTTVVPTPLRSLIAASNELPSGQEELEALYDRFLLRQYVGYVADNDISKLINVIASSENAAVKPLSPYELAKIKQLSAHVKLPEQIMQVLKEIWLKHRDAFKEDRRESLSDRRLVKVVNLLKVSAATNGRSEVDFSDILLLIHCLWCEPSNIDKVSEVLKSSIYAHCNGEEVDCSIVSDMNTIILGSDAPKKHEASRNIIKGYLGSGTKDDPIIISKLEHLVGIQKAEIGQQGYYFKQVNDIDASELKVWPKLVLKGTYNGGGFSIKGKESKELMVFSSVLDDSNIALLTVYGMSIVGDISNSAIINCESTFCIVLGVANNVHIKGCKSEYIVRADSWVSPSHFGLHITSCYASGRVASGIINSSVIENCFANVNQEKHDRDLGVGLFEVAEGNSIVRNCLVKFNGRSRVVDKLAMSCFVDESAVECNVIDGVDFNGRKSNEKFSVSLFTNKYDRSWGAKLRGNVICDDFYEVNNDLSGSVDLVSKSILNQFYFESILDWDFDSVWEWNNEKNEPNLQQVGVKNIVVNNEVKNESRSLLSEQCKANIWL
ncbi:AAA family ATPase [Plesiomonas shigelloides]|uniref:AAA family ATPase n=1 Tax=Plesiomonas shigelloides TaxID=703 RepID=UPI0012623071|nr:AAA family ATPase [Plesiomonas shigelloides]KAB7684773.1 AAA domain-containing protein [Plesiomonas shigelloides]